MRTRLVFTWKVTNASSAPNILNEPEVEERMKLALELEDPNIVVDLRHLSMGRESKYRGV